MSATQEKTKLCNNYVTCYIPMVWSGAAQKNTAERERKNARLNAELNQLISPLNPHFLFNTLQRGDMLEAEKARRGISGSLEN